MSLYTTQFYGNLEGSNSNTSEIKNITLPKFDSLSQASNYLIRDGLMCYVSGSLYYKKQGVSSPIRVLESHIDGLLLSGSVKDVTNLQISGSDLKFDILFNSGSTKTIFTNISTLQTDTRILSGSVDTSLYNIKIFETNSNVTTFPLSNVISNYVNNNMLSNNLNLAVDSTKLVNRGTLSSLFFNFKAENALTYGRNFRKVLEPEDGEYYILEFGEINPTTPNISENVKFIAQAPDEWGTVTNFNSVGGFTIETFNNTDDLQMLLSGSRFTGDWTYNSVKFEVDPEQSLLKIGSVAVDAVATTTNIGYITTNAGSNAMYVSSANSSTNFLELSSITQFSNETQITTPIRYISSLNSNLTSPSNLIHKGYVDTNFLNISGGTLLGVSGSGSIGYKAQNIKPSTPTSGYKLYANSTNALSWIGVNGYVRTIDGTSNTADRTYTLPNSSGTVALLETTNAWSGSNYFNGSETAMRSSKEVSAGVQRYDSITLMKPDYVNFYLTYNESIMVIPKSNSFTISPIDTQTTQPIRYMGDLSILMASSSNLIHKGYVDGSFLNISGATLAGVSGSGFIGYKSQNITPSTPTSGFKLYANSTNALSWIGTNGFSRTFDGVSNTANRTYTLPDNSGTISLTSDLVTYAPILNPTFSGSVSVSGSINSSGSITSQGITVGRGSGNVATNSSFGLNALLANTSGGENTAIGNGALRTNTSGFWNTAIGSNALNLSVATIYNVAVGTNSQLNCVAGSHNTSVGYNSLASNLSGSHNTAIGKTALSLNTGEFNTAIGSASGNGNNQGSKNTYIGYNTGGGITTGNSNTIIGANVSGLSSSLSNNIIIADGDGNKRIVVDAVGHVGIGTVTPNSSALLDLTSTTQGLLLPRMTTTQINAISTPSEGLTVFNTTLLTMCFYDGSVWKKVSHSNM